MKQRIALFVFLLPVVAWLSACGGSAGGSVTPNPTPTITSVTVSPSTAKVGTGKTQTFTATVTGTGNYSTSVTWSASAGTISSSGVFTAPGTAGTVTITATSTEDQTKTGSATVTVQQAITISVDPSSMIPNSELYSDFGAMISEAFSCTGCEAGDTLNVQSTAGGDTTTTLGSQFLNPWQTVFNFIGPGYVPGPISMWIAGADGTKSNTLWLTFDGSQNMAVEDSSSDEIYYAYSGNGTQGSFSVLKFKQDGTTDGNFQDGGFGIAVDNTTHDVVFGGEGNGGGIANISFDGSDGGNLGGICIPTSGSSCVNVLAVSTVDGLGCATQPEIDSASCFDLPTSVSSLPQPFQLPGIPSGSQPTPIKVLDASHVALYGRGDQTLRWYTITGTTATAAGTLQLSGFTPADANYWKTYPASGGWEIVQVGATLGVMGQVVNGDGAVSQKLALVNNTNQTLIQYVDLPAGTVHITADPTNDAIVAEYPDFTASTPITRFERIYVDTGNSVLLQSTSNLVPGAGFLVTNDGSKIAIFVEGKADFETNQ